MDPMTALLLSSLIGGGFNLLGGALAPQPQIKQPFTGDLDPQVLLGKAMANLSNQFNRQDQQVSKGVGLPDAFIHGLPATHSGGGLPMDIGLGMSKADLGHLTEPIHLDQYGNFGFGDANIPQGIVGGLGNGGTGLPPSGSPYAGAPTGVNPDGSPKQNPDGTPKVVPYSRRQARGPASDPMEALSALRALRG